MVRVTQLADDGAELATVEVDDFTIEVVYSGLADMLRQAAVSRPRVPPPSCDLSRQARQRRQRVLGLIRD
jgi:hypothetical protein